MPLQTNGTEMTMHVSTIDQATGRRSAAGSNGIGELGHEADRDARR